MVVGAVSLGFGPGRGSAASTGDYLALGDSISFGYTAPADSPRPDYTTASSSVGFPEDVGASLGLVVANLSCPGETSASLISATAPSNGCERTPTGTAGGYRARYPLHVSYRGSQLDAALAFLASHPRTRLVSVMIGLNDLLRCRALTADRCAAALPAVLRRAAADEATILAALRRRYRGPLVVITYYALPGIGAALARLNAAVTAAARPFGVRVADGGAAFGTDPCATDLLARSAGGACDIHPNPAGQEVLALAVEAAVRP